MAQEIRVADVRPNSSNFDLTVHVHSVGPVQEIPDKSGMGRRPNRLAEAVVGDATGNVVLSLWNHEVERVAAGDRIHVRDGYVKLVRGQVRVSVGRGGGIDAVTAEVQADPVLPNISEAKHQDDRPRVPRSFGGGDRGFGGDRNFGGRSEARRDGPRGERREWTPRQESRW